MSVSILTNYETPAPPALITRVYDSVVDNELECENLIAETMSVDTIVVGELEVNGDIQVDGGATVNGLITTAAIEASAIEAVSLSVTGTASFTDGINCFGSSFFEDGLTIGTDTSSHLLDKYNVLSANNIGITGSADLVDIRYVRMGNAVTVTVYHATLASPQITAIGGTTIIIPAANISSIAAALVTDLAGKVLYFSVPLTVSSNYQNGIMRMKVDGSIEFLLYGSATGDFSAGDKVHNTSVTFYAP